MDPDVPKPRTGRLRTLLILLVSVAVVGFLFRLTEAGSLTPSALPAATMQSLEDVYNQLVGVADSERVPAMKDGNVMNQVKCIIGRMRGFGECVYTFPKSPTPICVSGLVTSIVPGGDAAEILWSDFAPWHTVGGGTPTSRYYYIAGSATRSYGYDDDISGSYDCSDNAVSPVITDVFACNGSACDFCQTFIEVQDYTGTCAAPVPAGSYPGLVGPQGLSVTIDITDTAVVSWQDAISRSTGTITQYGVSKGGPFVTDTEPVSVSFDCFELGNNLVTWRACNGSDCNAVDMWITVWDSGGFCI